MILIPQMALSDENNFDGLSLFIIMFPLIIGKVVEQMPDFQRKNWTTESLIVVTCAAGEKTGHVYMFFSHGD
jgi:hypothetical protein